MLVFTREGAFIMRFQAKNFKRSDKSVSLNLKPMTILLGQNGAGKTTLTKALALGQLVVKSKLGELQVDAGWSRKFNVFGYSDVANDIGDSLEFEWVKGDFTYRQQLISSDHGMLYSKYQIFYTQNGLTVYEVEIDGGVDGGESDKGRKDVLVTLCPTFFKLVKVLFHSDGSLQRINFDTEQLEFASEESEKEWLSRGGDLDCVLGMVREIKQGRAEVHSTRVKRLGEYTYVEDGLVILLEAMPEVREEIEREFPAIENVLTFLKYYIDPQRPQRHPLLKTFKVKDRVTLPRTFDSSSWLWAELTSRRNLSFLEAWGDQTGPWLNSWLQKFGLCPFTVKEPLSGALTVYFDDGYGHFDLGTGHRQIFVLLMEFCFMLDWYKKRKPEGEFAHHIFVIEEPEVSLHPNAQTWIFEMLSEFQALMAEIDVVIIFVIETHSEYFLRRAQLAVKDGEATEDGIGIHYVSTGDNGVYVTEYDLDSNGLLLEKLPKGFMDESSRLIREVHFRN